jgi:hypothetical protein
MTMKLKRNASITTYQEKINNYWYQYNTGAIDGWSGVIFDVQAPRNDETIKDMPWPGVVSSTLVENRIKTSETLKYYFAPKTIDVITAQNGKRYTITPKNGTYTQNFNGVKIETNTNRWDQLMCKYIYKHSITDVPHLAGTTVNILQVENGPYGRDKHTWSDAWDATLKETKLQQQLRRCAIIYNDEYENVRDGSIVNGNQYRDQTLYTKVRDAGVFNDSILYAENNGTYTPIARIVLQEQNGATSYREAGTIELIHWLPVGATAADVAAGTARENVVLYDVLNALGYPLKDDGSCDFENARKYINKQLRAWVGVVAKGTCNYAKYVKQDKHDDENTEAVFLASWERPINLNLEPITPALDANTNENIIYLIDYLKLFDWRGDYTNQGYMYYDPNEDRGANHWWFWAYYNVKGIAINMDPSIVETNMHQANANTFVKLNRVTTAAKLWSYPQQTATWTLFGEGWDANGNRTVGTLGPWQLLDPTNWFNSALKEDAIEEYMGYPGQKADTYAEQEAWNAKKEKFGAIYYANNGDNVTVFDVKIPVTIYYEWGSFESVITWHIDTTHGR